MKKLILVLNLFFSVLGYSQIHEPVSWATSVERLSNNEYILISKASIEKGWHLYSQNLSGEGPFPTIFTYNNSESNFSLIGENTEGKGLTVYDSIFEKKIKLFDKSVVFKQRVRFTNDVKLIKGAVEFMVCDDTKCLPPIQVELIFNLNLSDEHINDNLNSQIISHKTISTEDNSEVNDVLYGLSVENINQSTVTCKNEVENSNLEVISNNKSLWSIFGLGFFGGILALLTPCVFPMIPLTVSFFTKKKENNSRGGIVDGLVFGFFIIIIYIALSTPFHLLDSVNPDILNQISTNALLNVLFFIIFIFFAFSFFGFYELRLPSNWTNITTKAESAGGYIGIFFMALTLALVSFSCTGPILGSLLAGSLSADGGAFQLTSGMSGFGMALGLPFALFAMFPALMKTLPKSGEWLSTTKVILGFLELALAFKFLSNADLVSHWGILKIEVFLIIWIIISMGLALFILRIIKFPNALRTKRLSFYRIAGGTLVIFFVIYLLTGFRLNKTTETYMPLKLLSGLAPPVGYSILHPNECPNNLNCFKDLKDGIAYAKIEKKPILLDFTGYACVNCRKMEEHIWPLKNIDVYLRKEYVIISLYVDDKKSLPLNEQLYVKHQMGGARKLENYGQKWANFQTEYFKSNSQPYYVLLNSDGKAILNQAIGYTPNDEEYEKFLQCGLEIFKSMQ